MALLPNISKYWVLWRSVAPGLSTAYNILTPSMGRCTTPLIILGSGNLAASRMVAATSFTWCHCERISPFDLNPFGQCITMPFRVPPKSPATCFVQRKGASVATDQPQDMWGKDSGPPHTSALSNMFSMVSTPDKPFSLINSLYVPSRPPSALEPLSPMM